MNETQEKTKIMSQVSFNVNTHVQRIECENMCNKLGHKNIRLSYEDYLKDLKSSMFCISPNGNGLESHRNWESLCMKCIPIIVPHIPESYYKKLPVILLNTWNDLLNINLDEHLYNEYMKKYDETKLSGNVIINEIMSF